MYSIPRRLPNPNYHRTIAGRLAIDSLSTREIEVFELMGNGNTTREIAEFLGLQGKTVETHRARIRVKMRLGNGTQLLCAAARWVYWKDRRRRT